MGNKIMSCELCYPRHPREIWRDAMFYVIDAADADLPGFVRVIATRHVKEMADLTAQEKSRLFRILECIEKIMLEELAPDKVNWASLGNMVPHVHWHIIARWSDDAFFPGSVWSERLRVMPSDKYAERRRKAQDMLARLVQELEKLN